jgi:putative transposase
MLEYKAEDAGIIVETQEESYTSQCSPYEEEVNKRKG